MASFSLKTFNSSFSLKTFSLFSEYNFKVSSFGSTITSPFIASTIIVCSACKVSNIAPTPTTAGNSKDLAIIDEWAVFPPISVTNASTLSKFIWAVSDGFNSLATMIVSGCNFERSTISWLATP